MFVTLIQAIHHNAVGDQYDHKAYDRTLLGHPEPKGSMANGREVGINPIAEQYGAAETDKKPDGEKEAEPAKALNLAHPCMNQSSFLLNQHSEEPL